MSGPPVRQLPNETLHRTSASGLKCERLASAYRIEHLPD